MEPSRAGWRPPAEIESTLRARGQAYGPIPFKETAAVPYVPWGVKLLLEELSRGERLLGAGSVHTKLTHVVVEDRSIRGVAVHGRGGRSALRARVYIDATGDAELARLARVRTYKGDAIQYPSMMFTMQNVAMQEALPALSKLPALIAEHFERERLPRRGGNLIPTLRPGEVLVAMSRIDLDGRPLRTDPMTSRSATARWRAACRPRALRTSCAGTCQVQRIRLRQRPAPRHSRDTEARRRVRPLAGRRPWRPKVRGRDWPGRLADRAAHRGRRDSMGVPRARYVVHDPVPLPCGPRGGEPPRRRPLRFGRA